MAALAQTIPAGTELADWKVLGCFTAGASGAIHKVESRSRKGLVAVLKYRRPDGICSAAEFEQEIAFAKRCPVPEAMVRFYNDGSYQDERYYIMELVEAVGSDLPPKLALDIFSCAAESLQLLHAAGLCHGDIKPGNLGRARGRTRFLDLGRGASCLPDLSDTSFVTTPAFASREMLRKCRATREGDVHALALTMRTCCGDRAKRIFAPAINEALDLVGGSQTMTAGAFRKALHRCFAQSQIRLVLRCAALTAIAALSLVLAFSLARSRDDNILIESQTVTAFCSAAEHREAQAPESGPSSNLVAWTQRAAATPAQAEAWVEEARGLLRQQRYEEAMACLEKAVGVTGFESGYAYGKIAECYYRGRGVDRDLQVSRKFATWAADLGDETGRQILHLLQRDTSAPAFVAPSR